uniref:DUF4781 domain-containing protein n=1 Tax=Glossina morsitans morsitans TaxID=37546 RepID=A0A1B0FKJ6_GLOMM
MTKRKTIKDVQQELASSLGFGDRIIWDFYKADGSQVLKKKIQELLPDQSKGQQSVIKRRDDLFTNVWKQIKNDLMLFMFYLTVKNTCRKISLRFFICLHILCGCYKRQRSRASNRIFCTSRISNSKMCWCVLLSVLKLIGKTLIIFSFSAEDDSTDCCMVYVDEEGRVYQNWQSYVNENVLPPGCMVTPHCGVYNFENGQVVLARYTTPNGTPEAKFLQKTQNRLSAVGFGAAYVPIIGMLFPIAAPVAAASTLIAVATGTMSAVFSAKNLKDRSDHQQSIDITDRDARGSWLGVACGVVGPTSLGAIKYMTRMATAGKATTGLEFFVNSMNITSIVLSGSGLGVGILDLILKCDDGDDVSTLDVMQLADSLVLFTHSVYNFQMASSIVDNALNSHIKKYSDALSNRQSKMFNKLSKETTRIHGGTQGKIDIIRNINDIPDRQYLNDLFKINKQLNENKVRPAFASKGQGIVLNNDVKVDTHVLRQSVQHQNGPNVLKSVIKSIPETISTTAKVSFTAHNPTPNPIRNCDIFQLANGAKICLEEFGSQFRENIYDFKEWSNLTEFIASKFPESIIRFLMNLSKTYIERLLDCREMGPQKCTRTESILFRTLKYCYNKSGEVQDFYYFFSKRDEILKHLDGLIKWSTKIQSIHPKPITKKSLQPSNSDKKFPDSTTSKNAHATEIQPSKEDLPTLPNPNEEFPDFFNVAENGASIFFKDFGLEFLINTLDRKALYRITEFLCSNFSEKTIRFLFNTTRRFVEHSLQHLDFELRVIVTTESILFRMFKYWYMNFNDDIENDRSKIDEIITNVRRYFTNKKNAQNITNTPDKEDLKELLKSKKQSKPNINRSTVRPSLRRNEILLNKEFNVGETERQDGSNSLQSVIQSTPDNTLTIEDRNPDSENINSFTIQESGAMISLSEFAEHFNKHIVDSAKINGLIEHLCSNLSEKTVRFLLKLTNSFIEKYSERIEDKLKMILTTESVLFRIFKYCHSKYEKNLNFEYLRLKRDQIATSIYFILVPTNRTDEKRKIKCQKCRGFYSISNI